MENAVHKAQLEQLIAENSPSLELILPRTNNKSDVWGHNFYRIVYCDGQKLNYVFCMECKKVITYKPQQGTGSLLRHRCFRERKHHNAAMGYAGAAVDTPPPKSSRSHSSRKRTRQPSSSPPPPPPSPKITPPSPPPLPPPPPSQQQPPSENTAQYPVNLTVVRRTSDEQKNHLYQLMLQKDADLELRTCERPGFVWTYGNFKLVFHNGNRQNFVLCSLCAEFIAFQSRSGTSRLMRHKCFRTLHTARVTFVEKLLAHSDPSLQCLPHPDPTLTAHISALHQDGQRLEFALCKMCGQVLRSDLARSHRCLQMESATAAAASIMMMRGAAAAVAESMDNGGGGGGMDDDDDVEEVQIKVEYHQQQQQLPSAIIEQSCVTQLRLAQMKFIGDCMLPPAILSNVAFQEMARHFVNIGIEYTRRGEDFGDEMILNAETIQLARNVMVGEIRQKLRTIINTYQLAYSCDIWEDLNSHQAYVTLMGHYIDETFTLRRCVFGVRRINAINQEEVTERVTHLLQSYSEKDITNILSNLVFVVNMPDGSGLDRFTSVNCSATSLKNIVDQIIAHPALEVAKACNESSPIERDQRTWMDVTTVLTISRNRQKADGILKLLQPFQNALSTLAMATVPTINQVYVFRKKLEDILTQPEFNETAAIRMVKARAHELVRQRFEVRDLHKLAVFLDPRFKSLKFMDDAERATVIGMAKRLISGEVRKKMTTTTATTTATATGGQQLRSKPNKSDIVKLNNAEYSIEFMDEDLNGGGEKDADGSGSKAPQYLKEYMDDHSNADDVATNEVDVYLNAKLTNAMETDVLEFWSDRKDLELLRLLARAILCIPATSSAEAAVFTDSLRQHARARLNLNADGEVELEAALLIQGN